MATANSMGLSVKNIVLNGARAKVIQHSSYGCKGRTVSVVCDECNGGAIVGVACAACAVPQRCTTPLTGGTARHGREATVITPAGWRCLECAQEQGLWNQTRDGFGTLIVG